MNMVYRCKVNGRSRCGRPMNPETNKRRGRVQQNRRTTLMGKGCGDDMPPLIIVIDEDLERQPGRAVRFQERLEERRCRRLSY